MGRCIPVPVHDYGERPVSEHLSAEQAKDLNETRQIILAKKAEILKLQAKLSVELTELDELEAKFASMLDDLAEVFRDAYKLDEP